MLRANQNRPRTFNFVDAKEHLPNGSGREDAKTAQERAISQRRVGEGRHVHITLPYGACLKTGRRRNERRCTRVDASEQSEEEKTDHPSWVGLKTRSPGVPSGVLGVEMKTRSVKSNLLFASCSIFVIASSRSAEPRGRDALWRNGAFAEQ